MDNTEFSIIWTRCPAHSVLVGAGGGGQGQSRLCRINRGDPKPQEVKLGETAGERQSDTQPIKTDGEAVCPRPWVERDEDIKP